MIIEKICIHNFGPFYWDQDIIFNAECNGVHIIRGGNGQGKTSLQRAILWALYGEVHDRKGQPIRPTSLLNLNAYEEDLYEFWVTIWFTHNGESWSIFRKMSSKNHNDNAYTENMKLDVIKDGQILSDPQKEIERLLPYHVSRFYFFDGEMLRDYEALLEQDQSSAKLLRDSIEHVLGVPYLKMAKEDLNAIAKQFTKERNRLLRRIGGKDLDEMAQEIQFNEKNIEDCEIKISNLRVQKENLENEILAKKREQKDLEEVRDLAQTRLNIEAKIKNLELDKSKFLNAMQSNVSALYKTLLLPVAKNVELQLNVRYENILEDYEKKRNLQLLIGQLEHNRNEQKCSLCGAILDENKLKEIDYNLSEARAKLELLGDVHEPPIELKYYKDKFRKMRQEAISGNIFMEINKSIQDIDYEIAMLSNQLKDIEEKLIGVDYDKPKSIEREIQMLQREKGRIEGLEESSRQDLVDLLKTKGELDRIMNSIPQRELYDLNKYLYNISNLIQIFEEAIAEYRDARRNDIEKIASEIFRQIRSKEEFDHLEINDEYGLSIITERGKRLNRTEWRSSGEEQLVALSLIGALNKCAQISAPIFMDTPFGRFDTTHGERVLRFLPNFADQIVLLVTDREFRKGDERFLDGKIRDDFTIESLGEKEGSRIRPT